MPDKYWLETNGWTKKIDAHSNGIRFGGAESIYSKQDSEIIFLELENGQIIEICVHTLNLIIN